jgi:magnesium transporter
MTPRDFESAVQEARNPDTNIWIDIQDCDAAELENKLDRLEVKGLARRLLLETRDRPGFYPMSKLTFMVIPVLAAAGDFHNMEHVAFLIRGNLLLTLRNARATRLQSTISYKDSEDWLPEGNIRGLMASFMIVLSLESLQRTSELRDMIMILEKQMVSDPESVENEDISDKRSKLLTLESVVSGQLPVLQTLISADKAALKLETIRDYLICALSNLQATDRSLDWLEGRIDVIRSMVDMREQEKINRRLGRLTIVSAIFLPITFLAGLWGMNFENMPGLRHPLGYAGALGFMLLIAAGIFLYFQKKGWFS